MLFIGSHGDTLQELNATPKEHKKSSSNARSQRQMARPGHAMAPVFLQNVKTGLRLKSHVPGWGQRNKNCLALHMFSGNW